MPDTDKYNIILKYLKRCIRNELTNRRGVYKLRCVLFFCEFLAYCTVICQPRKKLIVECKPNLRTLL